MPLFLTVAIIVKYLMNNGISVYLRFIKNKLSVYRLYTFSLSVINCRFIGFKLSVYRH